MKNCAKLFLTQMFSYCVVCVSFIALAKGNYALTFIADVGCGVNSYFLIRRVSQAKDGDHWGTLSYVLGGATGSVIAIWLMKLFHAQ